MLLLAIACVPLVIWLYLAFARGGFWRVKNNLAPDLPLREAVHLVAVIPARNEADVIPAALKSLFAQDLPFPLRVVLVDDNSTDGTKEAAISAAVHANATERLTVVRGQELPGGWTGKLWAVSQGIRAAMAHAPDYLLLTDADIVHGPGSIAKLAAIAQSGNRDLASYMVKLACETLPEKALIPAFVFFFLKLYPPSWVASARGRTAGAAGGCMLIRPAALERIGGIAAIRSEVIDDCALARHVKRSGGRVWLGLTCDSRSIRDYGTFAEIGAMISRTAFNQLQHSTLLLIAAIVALAFTYLLPPALLFTGNMAAAVLGAIAWLLMSICYAPMIRFYGRSLMWSFALPAIALFYMGATCRSAMQYWLGKGGQWKGRTQDVRPPASA